MLVSGRQEGRYVGQAQTKALEARWNRCKSFFLHKNGLKCTDTPELIAKVAGGNDQFSLLLEAPRVI